MVGSNGICKTHINLLNIKEYAHLLPGRPVKQSII